MDVGLGLWISKQIITRPIKLSTSSSIKGSWDGGGGAWVFYIHMGMWHGKENCAGISSAGMRS